MWQSTLRVSGLLVLIGLLGSSACVGPYVPLDAHPPGGVPTADLSGLASTDAADLATVIAAAREVILSREFAVNLAALELAPRVGADVVPGSEVLEAYLGTIQNVGQLYTEYSFSAKSCKKETASTGFHSSTEDGAHAVTVFGTCIRERVHAPDLPRRACAINTVAHEWTHAVINADGNQPFLDSRHYRSREPLVSYTIGTVAQCTYLVQQCVIDKRDFAACMQYVGTIAFDDSSCDLTGIEKFRTMRTMTAAQPSCPRK